jgi:PAS domain-containing protein
MFIPEPVRKKTEKNMNKLLNKRLDGKLKMKVISAGGNMPVVEWSVNVTSNNLEMAAGMILSLKNNYIMSNQEQNLTDAQMLRKKAEEQLKEKQKKAVRPVLETDVKKLLHELQVHQIELEMQNDELRQANETAETALKKYTILYDFAPMGYFTLDSDGSICELNFTGADILGDKRFTLVNRNFKLFVSQDSQSVFNKFLSKVYAGNAKESCEVMLSYDNNPLCLVYMEGIVTGDDRKCLLSVVDISGFKK